MGVPTHLRSAASFNADLWRQIHRRVEDVGPQIVYRKTKAHRSLSAAEVDPSDGAWFWHGNRHADEQCRELVKAIARQEGEGERCANLETVAVEAFKVLSSSVAWAFRHLGELEPPRIKRNKDKAARRGKEDQQVGEHVVTPRAGGGVICLKCRLCSWSNAGRRWLRQKPCRGDIVEQIHSSHSLRTTGSLVWCSKCGAYTTRMPRTLRAPCRGGPRSEAQGNVRRRLLAGLPPTTSALHSKVCNIADDKVLDYTMSYPPPVHRDGLIGCSPHHHVHRVASHDHVHHHRRGRGGGGSALAQSSSSTGLLSAAQIPSSYYAQLEIRRRARAISADGNADHRGVDVHGSVPGGGRADDAGPSSSTSSQAAATSVRWRITGKSPPAPALQEARTAFASITCAPSASSSWSSRLRAAPTFDAVPCHRCGGPTRTVCKGCLRRVCLDCARGRVSCMS